MTAGARVLSEPLGGSPLSLAIQQRAMPPELQPGSPATIEQWRAHVDAVRATTPAGWLDAIRPAFGPGGAAAKRLDRVAAGNGICITTGQQAGLFGGPLYTLTKALSALTLADILERELGVPVAPVFWAATDDADFLEASVAYVADADGLVELRLTDPPPPGTPMARAPLGDMSALLTRLRRACGSAPHAEYFEMARAAFTGHATVGDAYVGLMRGLLEPLGVAVMDSSHTAFQTAARPILLRALACAPAVAAASVDRAAALRKRGFEPQVQDDRGLSLVFAAEGGVKRRLSVSEGREFNERRDDDVVLSPNVLLRPLVERALIPTAAYVAGPGELAYFAQIPPIAEALGSPGVVGVPRWSCTIVEPFATRALSRLKADHHELRDVHALERRLAVAAMPEAVAAAWNRLQANLEASLAGVSQAVREDQLMPDAVMEGLKRSLAHRLSRAERRLLAAVKRRQDKTRHDLAVASGALFPLGQRQERVLSFVPPLARNGESLLTALVEGARAHAATLVRPRNTQPAAAR